MIEPIKRVIKLCLIAITVVLFSSATYAQVDVGAKLGVNINQFNQPGTIFGFNFGGFARYQVLDFVAARGELLYMQQGGARSGYFRDLSSFEGNIEGIEYNNRYVNLNNLEVVALAEITHPDFIEESVTPKLLVGISYGYLLSASESSERTYYYGGGPSSPSNTLTLSDVRSNVRSDYQHGQLGFIAGMALDFKVGERTFTSEIRYRRSINQLNLVNTINGVPGQFGDLYTSTISFNFGMTLFNF